MRTEHEYAQAFRWLAEGTVVLGRYDGGEEAAFPDDFSTAAVTDAVRGCPGWEFRIKPRTVKIGSREVEAPVLEPEEGQRLWFVGSDGEAYANTPKMLEFDIASGRAFATKEAALAAHDAITALLRGEA